jgi:uncharacterized cupin superfamily protein
MYRSIAYAFAVILAIALVYFVLAYAQQGGDTGAESPQPVRLNPALTQGKNLEPLPAWPANMLVGKSAPQREADWYTGPQLEAAIYESDDGAIRFKDFPCDEHVTVVNGKTTLTSANGEKHSFQAGNTFVVPKGWTGVWELKNGYREMIVFERHCVDAAMAKWFPSPK